MSNPLFRVGDFAIDKLRDSSRRAGPADWFEGDASTIAERWAGSAVLLASGEWVAVPVGGEAGRGGC